MPHGSAAFLAFALMVILCKVGSASLSACEPASDGSCKAVRSDQDREQELQPSVSLLQQGRAERRNGGAIRRSASESGAEVYAGKATAKIIRARVEGNSSQESNSNQIPVFPSKCPTVRPLTTSDNFSLAEYVRASWYVQEQQTIAYQRESQLDCVVGTYDDLGSVTQDPWTIPFYQGGAVQVYNYCSPEAGCSPTLDTNGEPTSILCGAYPDEDKAALKVLPCFLPEFIGGNYWVVALGIAEDGQYDWAVVSGGQPKVWYPDGCTTNSGPFAYFDAGLWIFSRKKNLKAAQMKDAKEAITEMGITLSLLKEVKQGAGCSYKGAYIKT